MMLNWQNILVGLILLAAVFYVTRRGLQRLRSFRASRGGNDSSACATACGSCGESRKPSTTPRTVFVEIGRSKAPARGDRV
jgi:hypothetical protein